jgi:hypothetical protein
VQLKVVKASSDGKGTSWKGYDTGILVARLQKAEVIFTLSTGWIPQPYGDAEKETACSFVVHLV